MQVKYKRWLLSQKFLLCSLVGLAHLRPSLQRCCHCAAGAIRHSARFASNSGDGQSLNVCKSVWMLCSIMAR